MTTPIPTGHLEQGDGNRRLVLTRTFRAPIDDVWASITEPERTERWYASWTGDAGAGNTIQYRLTHEEGQPEGEMMIDACEPPRHLAVSASDDYGSWRLEATLAESAGTTTLTFVQHLDPDVDVSDIGPGWEYYLDMLVASRDGLPLPSFDDYFPAQQAYYAGLSGDVAGDQPA
jgi:uncharacterized protein YndB with AHSA1/START domain